MKQTVKMWALVNATMRGKPILVPGSVHLTKKAVVNYREEYPFRAKFTPVKVTVTFEAPDA